MIAVVVAVAMGLCFLLGRLSVELKFRALRADRDQSRALADGLRADVATWRQLSNELHEENCELRKAAL